MPQDDLGLVRNDIVSLTKSGSGAPGTVDTYTFTLRDGTTFQFQVTNGANGSTGGVEKHEFTTVSDFTDWYLTIDLSMLISVAFFDADYNSMLCYIDNGGSNTKLYKMLPNGNMQELAALSSGEKIVAFLKINESQVFVPATRTIAGINLENNVPIEELFSRMSIKNVVSTLARLQELNPDHGYLYLVEENHGWYFWSNVNNQWVYGGEYKDNFLFENVALKFYDQIVSTGSDLNDYKNSCFVRILNPTNAPTESNALLCVYRIRDMVIQVVIEPVSNIQWTRRHYIPTNTWLPWHSTTLGDNSVTREKIADDNVIKMFSAYGVNDCDTVLTSEVHIATNAPHAPSVDGGVLITYASETNKYQVFADESGKTFIRKYTYSTSTWGSWIRTDGLESKKMFNDYNYAGDLRGRTEQGGFLNANGYYSFPDNYHSISYTLISCKEGDTFIYRGVGRSGAYSAIFYGQDGTTIVDRVQRETPTDFVEIVVPANCYYVTFSSFAATGQTAVLEVYKTNNFSKRIETYCSSVLNGKLWCPCGDSFTEGAFQGIEDSSEYTFTGNEKYTGRMKVYPFFIGNRTNCNVNNMGRSGMSLANSGSESVSASNCFSYENGLYTQIPENADYITLYFGINDSHESIPIGTIDDNVNTTFYGAWNIVLSWILNNRPNAKVGIIVSNGCDTTAYPEATIAIAKKWGIPYLDINGDDKLPMVIRANMRNLSTDVYNYYVTKYRCTSSNWHPNAKAHEDESFMIQQFLERL